MEIAHQINSVSDHKFHFRRHIAPTEVSNSSRTEAGVDDACCVIDDYNGTELMTIKEILSGKGKTFIGLIPIVQTCVLNQ